MEINLENAFFIAIKRSLGPFAASLEDGSKKIEEFIRNQTIKFLEKPFLTTLITSCVLILLIIAITISTLVTAGVLCIVVVIFIIEGFVLGMIIAAAITISILAGIIIMFVLILAFKWRTK